MFVLVVFLLVIFVVLTVSFLVGSLFLQSNIYSEPTPGLPWKAPAAAAALTLFYAFWVFLDYRTLDPNLSEIPYDTIFRFNATESRSVDRFLARFGPADDDSVTKELTYSRKQGGSFSSAEYRDDKNQPFNRTGTEGVLKEIIVKDDKFGELKFKPDLKAKASHGGDSPVGYHQVGGGLRMEPLGNLSTFRWGLFLTNVFLNGTHLVVWFLCLWLLLRYQWSHALFIGVILWGMATWGMPMLLDKTQSVVREKAGVLVQVRPHSKESTGI